MVQVNCVDCGRILIQYEIEHAQEKGVEDHLNLCCDCFDEKLGAPAEKRIIPRDVCSDPEKLIKWLDKSIKSYTARLETFKEVRNCVKGKDDEQQSSS